MEKDTHIKGQINLYLKPELSPRCSSLTTHEQKNLKQLWFYLGASVVSLKFGWVKFDKETKFWMNISQSVWLGAC